MPVQVRANLSTRVKFRPMLRVFRHGRHSGLLVLFLVFFVFFVDRAVFAQTKAESRPDRGIQSVGSYAVSNIENVSLTNGNMNLSIPLASLPPIAGGKLSYTLRATYNSKLWNVTREEVPNTQGTTKVVVDHIVQGETGGWRIEPRYTLRIRDSHENFISWVDPNGLLIGTPDEPASGPDPDFAFLQFHWYKVILTTPDGAEHELRPLNYESFPGTREYLAGYYKDIPLTTGVAMKYYSFDGSFIWAVMYPPSQGGQWDAYLPDGTHIANQNGIQRIVDNHGNAIKIYSETSFTATGSVTTTYIQDETQIQGQMTGREIKYIQDSSGPTAVDQVLYQTVGGTWETIDITYGETAVRGKVYTVKNPDCPVGPSGSGGTDTISFDYQSLEVIRSIALPQTEANQPRQQFTFNYNSDATDPVSPALPLISCTTQVNTVTSASHGFGSVSQMVMPSGAVVNYAYSLDGLHFLLTGADDVPGETLRVKTLIHDGNNAEPDMWYYSIIGTQGSVTGPDGSESREYAYAGPGTNAAGTLFGGLNGKGGLVYKSETGAVVQSQIVLKRRVERHWTLLKFDGGNDSTYGHWNATFNPVVDAEYTTLIENGSEVKTAIKTFTYDYNGNMMAQTDYDWVDPLSVPRNAQGEPNGAVPAGAVVLRGTNNTYYNQAAGSGSVNVYAKRDLSTATPRILNALQQTITGSSQTQLSYDGQGYGVAPVKGNVTNESRWDSWNARWLATTHTYDPVHGNRLTTADPKGNVTQFFYDDVTLSQPTRIVVDPLNGTGAQTTSFAYDYSTGLVTSVTDANGNVATTDYTNQTIFAVDPYGRPGVVTSPADSQGRQRKVRTLYHDNDRKVETFSDLNSTGDGLLKSQTSADQVGRPVLGETSENGSTYTIQSQTIYQQAGKVTFTSNPTRGGESTDGWTRTTKDELGRVVDVTTFSGSAAPLNGGVSTGSVTTSYFSNQVTVTDQAGKSRSSFTDGLGRLIQVIEAPGSLNYSTSYSYDSLGNLTGMSQGQQSRSFSYDSLSRLRSATNPESGTISYSYDDNGNLTQKTDGRGVATSFAYDGLNRVTLKSYSDATTPAVTYAYDTVGVANSKGRLTSVSSSVSTYGYSGYDALGRVQGGTQTTSGQSYSMSYAYNLAGGLTSMTYPSGRVVTTNYDAAGRISQVSGVKGAASTTYAASFSYTAHGAVGSLTLGNGLIESTTFNNRLQPTNISLGSLLNLAYNYGLTNNNGNVLSMTITPGTGQTPILQTFTYDVLNRLQSGSETVSGSQTWKQTNGFDQYGNRWIDSLNTTGNVMGPISSQADISAANNRIQKAGYVYDSAGNMTSEPGKSYTFDGENKIVTANVSGSVSTYVYDGDGRRVKKVTPSGTTVYVYDAAGQMIAEYSDAPSSGPGGTEYATADHLGTPRLWTSSTGAIISRHDYLPFGEELFSGIGSRSVALSYPLSAQTDGQRKQFTSKERDTETGLDYFLARYYSSAHGRFASPDEFTGGPDDLFDFVDVASDNPTFYADLHEPQSLNKYQYAYNNPLHYIDPDGHGVKDWLKAAAETVSDFANGVKRGFNSTISGGVVDGPSPNDTVTNRVGQVVGTAIVGGVGEGIKDTGVAISGTGVGAIVGVPVATAGVALEGAAVLNGVKVVTTPIQRSSNGEQSSGQKPQQENKPSQGQSQVGRTGGRNQPKDRSLQGTLDQQKDIRQAQATHRKRGQPDRIQSTGKSDQNVKHKLRRIKSSKNLED